MSDKSDVQCVREPPVMTPSSPAAVWSGVRAFGGRLYRTRVRRDIPILTFHRIRPGDGVTEQKLSGILDFVASRYHVITLGELVDLLGGHSPLPRDHMVLTFDDGTRDHYTLAAPALRRRGLRATFGVIGCTLLQPAVPPLFWYRYLLEKTTRPSVRFSFPPMVPEQVLALDTAGKNALAGSKSALRRLIQDSEYALAVEILSALGEALQVDAPAPEELFMTVEQVQALAAEGHEPAAHSLHHKDVHQPNPRRWVRDLGDNFDIMNAAFGPGPHAYIYPFGKERRPEVHACIREAGFSCAATSEWGTNTRRTSPYSLRRIGVDEKTCLPFATVY